MEKTTPLYENHKKRGGKMVPFAGYLLPVQYETGVITEHMAVRKTCGLFDVSHMGEIICKGFGALELLNRLLTNDFTDMYDGQARYSLMCYKDGGCVDDLIVYKMRDEYYFIVVNAANKDKDLIWMKEHETENANFIDVSESVAQIAVQGPKAYAILSRLFLEDDLPQKYYSARFDQSIQNVDCMISKTGYTGEDGYELYMAAEDAPAIWELLLETGKDEGLIPCGLGARDTLRLEAGMPLYGHEIGEGISPFEAGLGFAVKLKKKEFVGREALASRAVVKNRIGLKIIGRGIVREHMQVYMGETQVGITTSGTHSPYLGYPVAMALVDKDAAAINTRLTVDVRGRRVEAEVVKLPFYSRTR